MFDRVAGGLLGYQSRRLTDADPKPKYLTYKDKGKRLYYWAVSSVPSNTVVITEDALSAEKVSKHNDAVAVLTTTADNELRDTILDKGYNRVIIWLDDDNVDVKRKQLALKTMLEPYLTVTIIRTGKDPKRHSYYEIEEVLNSAS